MKDQHEKITGYRDLTQEEIDLMNAAKALEQQCLSMVSRVQRMNDECPERMLVAAAEPGRWASIARTDIQTGFMALVRAVAKPVPADG